jgi:hypothetical protein
LKVIAPSSISQEASSSDPVEVVCEAGFAVTLLRVTRAIEAAGQLVDALR